MSRKERRRLEVLARVDRGELGLKEAAELLSLSYRQIRRIRLRFVREGDVGLVHGLRGRSSNRKWAEATQVEVLGLYREKFADFGATLACEELAKAGHQVSRGTLRRWLLAEGLLVPRRKRSRHRSRRTRRSCFGELVQMDGSGHDWFEGRRGWCCLMVMVDDATGRTFARFYERETLEAAFDVFGRYAAKHGLPRALYVDRAGIYRSDREPTGQELIDEQEPVTQFGRAMRELDVELILANSPQAKGRVERRNGTLQDRLVKMMRLAGVGTMEAGNRFLEGPFLKELDERFAVEAAEPADVHHEVEMDLSELLCEQEERAVGKDWCVRWRGRLLQIDKTHEGLGLMGRRVTVREKADGTLRVIWKDQWLKWQVVLERPKARRAKKPVVNNKQWIPPATHPWRGKGPAVPAAPGTRAP